MARPRSSIAELERLLGVAEPGSHNLGRYIAFGGEELARRLGVASEELAVLVVLPDEEVAPQIDVILKHRANERAAAHQTGVHELGLVAAQRLGATAVWINDIATVDSKLLFGELLLDTSRSYITLDAFGPHGAFQVNLPRTLLVNVAKELGRRRDLLAWVDEAGLHFRWGRGGLNFLSQLVPASERASVLHVNIPPPLVEEIRLQPEATPPLVRPRVRRGGSWLADILSALAFS